MTDQVYGHITHQRWSVQVDQVLAAARCFDHGDRTGLDCNLRSTAGSGQARVVYTGRLLDGRVKYVLLRGMSSILGTGFLFLARLTQRGIAATGSTVCFVPDQDAPDDEEALLLDAVSKLTPQVHQEDHRLNRL